MNELLSMRINIFLTVDLQTINSYFNKHDPAPLYKRLLNHRFEEYIMTSVATARRHSVIFYKLKCNNEINKQYAEPLMYAIRRHFAKKKQLSEAAFSRFKRKSLILLLCSLTGIIITHGLMPIFLNPENRFESIIITSFEVLSWVILWRPIDKLIFDWNPHLKEIELLSKLESAEMILVEEKQETVKKAESYLFALPQTA